jgi:uncharacterized damage-inducible protein DinB
MKFNITQAIEILERTPSTLGTLLDGLSEEWTENNEGEESWSPYDVVGHLIHGEKTDWIKRLEIVLADGGSKIFEPFDRFAQFEESKGKTLNQLLAEFKDIRTENLQYLKSKNLNRNDFEKVGIHPALGEATLENLLSTWVVHDLNHLSQISRVMAKQYKDSVGPWVEYLPILK